jgi:Iron-sulfur cluster-binding domain
VFHVNGTSLDPHQRIVLGNVLTDSLSDLWSSPTNARVRNAHRTRNESELEFCRGCAGR